MAFSYTIVRRSVYGNMKIVAGTYSNNSSSTGGTISTNLRRVEHITLTPNAADAVAAQHAVDSDTTTMPVDSGDVAIATGADEGGTFIAFGK